MLSSSSTFLRPFWAFLIVDSELVELVARDVELLGEPPLGDAVALDLGELALDLVLVEAGAALELGGPGLGALDLGDQALELLDDLVDRLLVEPHLLERRDELARGLDDLDVDLLLAGVGLDVLALFEEVELLLVEALDLVDEADDAPIGLLLVELLVVALGVLDQLLDADLVLAELLAEVDDLAHGDGRVEDGGVDAELADLDPLGDLHLALAGEQRDAAHLPEVHADRIVGLRVVVDVLFLVLGGDDELLLVGLFVGDALGRDLHLRGAVDDLDVLVAEGADDVVELVRGHVGGERVVDLVVGQEAFALAGLDELLEGLAIFLAALGRRRGRAAVAVVPPCVPRAGRRSIRPTGSLAAFVAIT